MSGSLVLCRCWHFERNAKWWIISPRSLEERTGEKRQGRSREILGGEVNLKRLFEESCEGDQLALDTPEILECKSRLMQMRMICYLAFGLALSNLTHHFRIV